MDITYLGGSGFQLRGRDASLFVDPTASPDRRANARAILMSGYGAEPAVDVGDARVISRPGEYEVSGILIRAIRTSRASADDASNLGGMAYAVSIDGVDICHLGHLSRVLTTAEVSELGEADVVLLPVGGEETLAPNLAAQVATQLGPKIIIPMLWQGEVERSVTEAARLRQRRTKLKMGRLMLRKPPRPRLRPSTSRPSSRSSGNWASVP